MKIVQLSIIIVSYNTAEYTIRALESVYKQTKETSFEIIVVDNHSCDRSATLIRQRFPDLHLIESETNLGFAGGVCLGVNQAQGEYLLLLNPDTLILENAIDKLMAFAAEYPDKGIWGGITLNNDLTLNTQHAWSRLTFSNLLFSALGLSKMFKHSCFFNYANYGCWKRDSIKEVDIVSGCFFLTRKTVWDRLGGFDTNFFMYGEEANYCLCALKQGYQPIVTPEARIIHHGGVSHTRFSGKQIKLLKGKVELIKRHVPTWKHPVYIFLIFLYVFNKYLFSVLFQPGSEQSQEWSTVFVQRSDWLKGYR